MEYENPAVNKEPVVKEIASEDVARQLAVQAEGTYIEGVSPPAISGNEVALPILDEATGDVLGHIVADQIKLISALNEVGLVEIAAAVAGVSAGAATGAAAGTGFALGTTGAIAAAVAVGTGIALIVSSGGSKSTTSHP